VNRPWSVILKPIMLMMLDSLEYKRGGIPDENGLHDETCTTVQLVLTSPEVSAFYPTADP